MAINFDQILYDLQAAINANITGIQNSFVEGEAHEIENMSNMPLANYRLDTEQVDTIYVRDGFSSNFSIAIDLITFDLGNFEDAVSARSDLVISVRDYLIANPIFSNSIISSQITNIYFTTPVGSGGGQLAMATIILLCKLYAE